MYSRILAAMAVATTFVTAIAHAGAPAPGRNLAAPCAICHGTDGHSVGGSEPLAGMPRPDMVRKLGEFKSGAKPATVMHQISKGYSDKEIALLAEFFATQKK
jgi:cytochrome c553